MWHAVSSPVRRSQPYRRSLSECRRGWVPPASTPAESVYGSGRLNQPTGPRGRVNDEGRRGAPRRPSSLTRPRGPVGWLSRPDPYTDSAGVEAGGTQPRRHSDSDRRYGCDRRTGEDTACHIVHLPQQLGRHQLEVERMSMQFDTAPSKHHLLSASLPFA